MVGSVAREKEAAVRATIYIGDVLDRLRDLPDESVQCAVTSPPYWGLRNYGVDGQIGLEATPKLEIVKAS
jgi:DNA modification methylase